MKLRVSNFVLAASACFFAGAAYSATLTSTTSKEGKDIIFLSGEITDGDSSRFLELVRSSNTAGRAVSGIRLNSAGGNLAEGLSLAEKIRVANIATVVANGTVCASACFLAFAAGSEKFVSYSARVGIHGASDRNGRETVGAAAATVGMARAAKELGVPAVILGKMVTTPPDQILWLSPDDLRAMGATITGRPNQTFAPTISNSRPALPSPNQTQGLQASKPTPTWDEAVTKAAQVSAEQNGGRANHNRVCQPEFKTCSDAIFLKGTSGEMMVRATSDLNGKIVKRDICTFNGPKDIRECVDWDTDKKTKSMKNAAGEWFIVE